MLNIENPIYKTPKSTSNGGVIWLSSIVGFSILFLVCMIATQYLASSFEYQSSLGQPAFFIFGTPIYPPLDWIKWIWRWNSLRNVEAQHFFSVTYYIVVIGSLLAFFAAGYIAYRRTSNLHGETEHIHGSAHWATLEEVKETGLFENDKGVYIGGYKHPKTGTIHYLRHDGPEHIMLFAPTRSGKGVGNVLPTLLSWKHSALIHDIKGENWALTAGWRSTKANNFVCKFEPTAMDGSSICFNPLEEIRLGTDKEVSDVQNLVTMIVDPDGKGVNDHWAKTGHALLVGAVLHVLYAEENKTLEGVANFLSDPSRTIDDTLNYMLNSEHDPHLKREWHDNAGQLAGIHPVVSASARDMLNKSENERSGVLSTALSFLTLYRDPIVAKNTRHSEFKISDLMNAQKPVSLYLVVPPSDKDRLKPLIRLIINQVVRKLTEKMEFRDGKSVAGYRHRLLLMLDEFPSLGKLDIFQESLAFIAGYGMKAYLITQDISQLYAEYGREESIMSNCHIRAAYAPNKQDTAEALSKMTGTTTIVRNTHSFSGRRMTPMLSNVSTSIQENARPLLTSDEVSRLPGAKKDLNGNIVEAGDMLVFVAGHSPIYAKQILYFADPVFSERAKIIAPVKSDRLLIKEPLAEESATSNEKATLPDALEKNVSGNVATSSSDVGAKSSVNVEVKETKKDVNLGTSPPENDKANELDAYSLFDDLLPSMRGNKEISPEESISKPKRDIE